MTKNPLTNIKKTSTDTSKKLKASDLSYSLILKGHELFKFNRYFQRSDFYERMNNIDQFI